MAVDIVFESPLYGMVGGERGSLDSVVEIRLRDVGEELGGGCTFREEGGSSRAGGESIA